MNLRYKFKCFFVLILMCICACNVLENNPAKHNEVYKRILVHVKGDSTISEDLSPKKYATLVGLDDLRNGYDSLCLRVWYWAYDTSYIIDLRVTKDSKTCSIISFGIEETINRDSAWIIIYKKILKAQPKLGWERLFDYLMSNGIMTLPDGDSVTNAKRDLTGGTFFQFEIATKNNYRNYGYLEPYVFEDTVWQAKKVVKILDYINKEFDLPPLKKWK